MTLRSLSIGILGELIFLLTAFPVQAAWPFDPPTRPVVPAGTANPVDAFIRQRLERAGLQPNPPADKLTLLRRVTHDLTGLVPTSEEMDAALADRSEQWYERTVDRLLASPRFGERWAQHWLDVVRYAETDGFKLDRWRPHAHGYRDYVIRAGNDDLPYDRFIRQQLAGDELEPDNPDALVATGLLRLHPEESNGANYRMIRQEILDDLTDVFGAAFLGLTVGCARCHDHKFDPLTQKDYYRLQAFFAPISQHDDLSAVSAAEYRRYRRQLAAWETKTASIRGEMDALLRPMGKVVFEESVVVFDPDTQKALRTAEEERTPLQRQLAHLASKQIERSLSRMHRRLSPAQRQRYEALKTMLAWFDPLKPTPLPTAMAVTDVGSTAPPTHRLAHGNYRQPRELLEPGFPAFLERKSEPPPVVRVPGSSGRATTGRRSALALWLTRPDHPLTARVVVNRIWQHYFGKGIVATPNDFGEMGGKPSHPELLDFLARDLIDHGWKPKRLHRLIVMSATYRQASPPEKNPAEDAGRNRDPGNHLLWHARARRRDAEAIRDTILQASGQLNLRMYGLSALPRLPGPLEASRYGWYASAKPEDRFRRSIYVYTPRNLQIPLFSVFDAPDRVNSCPTRVTTTTAPQALTLLNGRFALEQARYMGERLETGDRGSLIVRAYRAALGRNPRAAELSAAREFLARQEKTIGGASAAREAAIDFCHALLNASEFLYLE